MALRRQMPQAAGTITPVGRRKKGSVWKDLAKGGLDTLRDVAGFQAAQQLTGKQTKSDRMMECMLQQSMGSEVTWDPTANNGDGACVPTGGVPAPPPITIEPPQ